MDEAEQALEDFQEKLQAVLDEVRERPVADARRACRRPSSPKTRRRPRDRRRRGLAAQHRGEDDDGARGLHAAPEARPTVRRPRAEQVASWRGRLVARRGARDRHLALEGTDVRLVGQDTRRGTFSQRHAALVDYETGAQFVPLCHLEGATGRYTVRDSLLSEYAAVGFEYGYSVERPETLVAWEAQFGDFVNGAEIIIDNFLVASEDKWGQLASLVLLLPHGYEGQGPEHSSGRIERFLSLCARNNLRVAMPSTRSAVLPPPALPGPPAAAHAARVLHAEVPPARGVHPLADRRARRRRLRDGARRRTVTDPGAVRTVVLAIGQGRPRGDRAGATQLVADGSLAKRRVRDRPRRAALPVARRRDHRVLDRFAGARDVCWLQEEPENMGPWPFVHHQLHRALRDSHTLRHVASAESASPATGSMVVFEAEQADLLTRVFG